MSSKKASLFSIIIFNKQKEGLKMYLEEFSLHSFSFFKRTPVQEMIQFISNRIVQNIETERPQEFIHKVEEGDSYKFFMLEKKGFVYVISSLLEYPVPTLYLLIDDITKYIQEKNLKFPAVSQEIFEESAEARENKKEEKQKLKLFVKQQIKEYQNYEEKDVMLQIQNELDDVHNLLSKTVESAIGRGQKLHDLINSAEQLSFQTKSLYKLSKKQNQKCCGIM